MGHIKDGRFSPKTYNRMKNGREKDERKISSDAIGLDDDGEG